MTALYAFLANLSPARRRRRRELRRYLTWNKDLVLVDVVCPHCGFVQPVAADNCGGPCAWCGMFADEEDDTQ